MTMISVRHGLPARTTDAGYTDDDDDTLSQVFEVFGMLSPEDLTTVKAILSKYGSSGARVTPGTGIASADAADRAIEARQKNDQQAACIRDMQERNRQGWAARQAAGLAY